MGTPDQIRSSHHTHLSSPSDIMALSMAASSTFNAGLARLSRSAGSNTQARRALTVRAAESQPETSPDTLAYVKTLPGITAPFNNVFDPLDIISTSTVAEMRRYREAEVTHGRVAMLASVGFVVGEQLEDFPLFFNWDGQITGPAITQFQQVGQGFWEPLVLVIGIAEAYRVAYGWASPDSAAFNTLKPEYNMGDVGFDPLGLKPTDAAELKTLQTKELNNGRLAMISIAAFVAEELVSGQEVFEHLFLRLEGKL